MSGVMGGCLVVVRLRGSVGIPKEVERIFEFTHLPRKNHATVITNSPSFAGSLQRLKDYATWGEVSKDVLAQLIRKRGRLVGGERVTDEYVKEALGYDSIDALAEAIRDSEVDFWKIEDVKPLFRLHPPKGGFRRRVKRPYPEGELGYRATAIDDLLTKMM